MPLGQIDLLITFGDQFNYRTKNLTFEVVGFPRTFHTILRRPCYVKFMAVPNYTYLKLKKPSPHGVITIGTSFQWAYEYEVECSGELAALKEEVVEEALEAKQSTRSFESIEGSKEVLIDPSSSEGKMVRVGTTLSSE